MIEIQVRRGCSECKGTGQLHRGDVAIPPGDTRADEDEACPACQGSGRGAPEWMGLEQLRSELAGQGSAV